VVFADRVARTRGGGKEDCGSNLRHTVRGTIIRLHPGWPRLIVERSVRYLIAQLRNSWDLMRKPPKIIISTVDADRLYALLDALPADARATRQQLEDELDRAEIVAPQDVPANVVTMNSTVRFRVASSEEQFSMTLVYPKDMDDGSSRISVLAPVGSALLGLAEGDEIEWPGPDGGMLLVNIEEVSYQPERAGIFALR
jgi:regulator of nucleoside diphosphate kinase